LRSEAQRRADEIAMLSGGTGAAGGRGACCGSTRRSTRRCAATTPRCWPASRARFDIDRERAGQAACRWACAWRPSSARWRWRPACSSSSTSSGAISAETAQVAILLGAALGSLGLDHGDSARATPSGYFTKLAAMVAFACFVLNLAMLEPDL
jgi:hypothetical protein